MGTMPSSPMAGGATPSKAGVNPSLPLQGQKPFDNFMSNLTAATDYGNTAPALQGGTAAPSPGNSMLDELMRSLLRSRTGDIHGEATKKDY